MAINARQLQLRRGTTEQHADFIGAEGEITFDTTTKRLRLHDHVQVGGYEIPKSNEVVHNTGDETVGGTKTFDVIKCTNPAANKNDTTVATTKFVNDRITASHAIPVGLIAPYAGTTAPSGWLMCNGQAVSRTTYSSLFAIVGTAYGAGNGSTTFNLPNYTNRVAQGLGYGYLNAGLPEISGTFNPSIRETIYLQLTGAFYNTGSNSMWYHEGGSWGGQSTMSPVYGFKASNSNNIYGNSTTVQPQAVKTYWIIKY